MNEVRNYEHLPEVPGVYFMKNAKRRVLYVGKAANLRHRVASYFTRPHDARIQKLVTEIHTIGYEITDTVIEALVREAECIKTLTPPYNIKDKDDKSFLYVVITKEKTPRLLLVRGKDVRNMKGARYGPFTSAASIREALRIVRRIFPYNTHTEEELTRRRMTEKNRGCTEYQIGLCPGACRGVIEKKEYTRTLGHIKHFFEGKKKRLIVALERDMRAQSKKLEFEKAEKTKRQLFALQHIQDVALIKESELSNLELKNLKTSRIEGYDISNISGTSATGSMVVFINGQPDKNEYRKFKIKTITHADDTGMLQEMMRRRLNNAWPLPECILVDGGIGQVHAMQKVLSERGVVIPVVGIAKGPERKRNDIIGTIPEGITKETLIRVRDEAHRFAVAYHKIVRSHALFQ